MNFTSREIRDVVKIARDNPEMDYQDIITAIIDGYQQKSMLQKIISNVKSLGSDKPTKLRPSIEDILQQVCLHHHLPVEVLKKKSRKRNVIRVKQQYCLIGILFRYTQQSIADEVNVSHATVLHHRDKALDFFQTELEYSYEIGLIFSRFPHFETILKDRITDLITT